jgi:secreted trypsin-like serine protease
MKTLMYVLFAYSMTACAMDEIMDQPDDDATDDQSIIGGTIDHGDLCVVAVIVHEPGFPIGLCTGTIIGRNTVLTAAHCVTPEGNGNITQIELAEPGHISSSITATSWIANPAWNRGNPEACHDEGIIHTTFQALSPICNRGRLHPHARVRIVGYGANTHSGTGAGIKRQATVAIDASNRNSFRAGSSRRQTCSGDSGGPAFQGGRVVGVTSFGHDHSATSVCFGGDVYCRVDADATWIEANTLGF